MPPKRHGFVPLNLRGWQGVQLDSDEYPTHVHTVHRKDTEYEPRSLWINTRPGDWREIRVHSTFYGIVTEGCVTVLGPNDVGFVLSAGQYFCVPICHDEKLIVFAAGGTALLIERIGYYGYPQAGGPLEEAGRLKYIDGCSDTLLICPPVVGEPCLNHLHIPAGTNQTAHTHPSQRIGVITKGSGYCLTPYEGQILLPEQTVITWPKEVVMNGPDDLPSLLNLTQLFVKTPLKAGMGWWIPTGLLHSFHTQDDSLDVVAWHPDSDFGPSHDHHPMVSRTYVNGVAASQIDAIRTTEISA